MNMITLDVVDRKTSDPLVVYLVQLVQAIGIAFIYGYSRISLVGVVGILSGINGRPYFS